MAASRAFLLTLLLANASRATEAPYDPLRVDPGEPAVWEGTALDASRHREVPLKVYLPASQTPAAVVLFSHGLGGSREGSAFLGRHWARRGYVAVFLQHPGSDESVWRQAPAFGRMQALREAATVENFLLRVQDVTAAIDQLAAWNASEGHRLSGRLDLSRLGMSGHSFGAVTTQAVTGQAFPQVGRSLTEKRIKAALVLSPSAPESGGAHAAFASVTIPWLLMTGTRDDAPIRNVTAASRLLVFPALPEGQAYELVLDSAHHSVFTDSRASHGELASQSEAPPSNPGHLHRVLGRVSQRRLEGAQMARRRRAEVGPRSGRSLSAKVIAPERGRPFLNPPQAGDFESAP